MAAQDDRFKNMVESSLDWFWEFDENADFTYVSPRIKDLLGYDPEEIIGLNAFDLMDDEEAARVRIHFDPLAEKYLPFKNLENINIHKDGHEVVIESSGTPIFDEAGTFRGYRGIDRDITARKQIEQALRLSETSLREAQSVACMGSYNYDIKSDTWSGSENLDVVLGLTDKIPKTLDGWASIVHPEDRDLMGAYFKDHVLAQRNPFDRSYRIIRPSDGVTRWIQGRGRLEVNSEGDVLRMIGTVQDITQLKEVEEQLVEALNSSRRAHHQLDILFSSLADPLILTDVDNKIVLVNKATEKMFAIDSDLISTRPVTDLINEQIFLDQLQRISTGQQYQSDVTFQLTFPGHATANVFQASTTLVSDMDGDATELVTVLRDITREYETDRLKSEFISIAAHELRTPLTAVMGFAEILEKESILGPYPEAKRKEYLSIVLQKCEQTINIIEDFLCLSRIESGRPMDIEKRPCQFISELCRIVNAHGLESDGHKYIMSLPDDDITIICDVKKIEQVVDNLLNNAIKYSIGKADIEISAMTMDDKLVVSVTDRGIGMNREQMKQAFDKFYRADMSTTAVGGLGLGLTLCRSIVESHGGSIFIESQPEEGTTVSFTLPI